MQTAASLRLRCAHDFKTEEDVCTPSTLMFHLTVFRCLSIVLWFCGAALVQRPRDSGVVCASLCSVDLERSRSDDKTWDDGAKHDENIERGHDHQELSRSPITIEVVRK